jgi:cell wall-associated NlpC family hydrolase
VRHRPNRGDGSDARHGRHGVRGGAGLWSGPEVPGDTAVLLADGTAAAPSDAPEQVKQAIWAANSMQALPYRYGGGHNLKFDVADGADCSGTVSFALHAAGLLDAPLDSGSFMTWGEKGKGDWITVYTNPSHAYAVIAGLRLDTSVGGMARTKRVAATAFERGPRWRPMKRSARGFVKRHPLSF